ncbi:MAG: glycosyltransferase family 39 protein [Alphaproteobacteria bacterium]|nr:glycosyltransferase family 39 protein [Alphaproteobacteria bacterium]
MRPETPHSMTPRILAPLLLALYAVIFLAPGFFVVPPLDRDEARFAQASKQMLESGDFVAIRFNDEARNKKPAGIYWMQAASAALFGGPAGAPIWAYRIPSALGAVLAVVFTYLAGAALMDRRAAWTGAALFAVSILLIAEGHIAKTDAMLCAAVTATQAGLAHAFLRHRTEPEPLARWGDMLLVWGGIGIATLLKGPIGPMVAILTVAGIWLLGGGIAWLRHTRPRTGVLLALAIVLPWAILITRETGGTFWTQAIGGDMLSKAAGGQESHGGWPGTYLALVTATLFPASILLVPAAWRAARRRAEPWALFLIAWVVPAWIVFELVPTKLPHYVLPLYPALALVIGSYLTARRSGEPEQTPLWARIAHIALWAVVAVALAAAITVIPYIYGGGTIRIADLLLAPVILAAAGWLLSTVLRGTWSRVLPAAAVLAAVTCGIVFQRTLPSSEDLLVSPRLAAAAEAAGYRPGLPITAAGYTEPSLVFLTATDIRLAADGADAAAFVAGHPGAFALIEQKEQPAFDRALASAGIAVDPIGTVAGFNYSRGRKVTIALFRERGR